MKEPASEPTSEATSPAAKPWHFKKGNKHRQQRAAAVKAGVEPKVPHLLTVMRFVYSHAESADKTQEQKNVRKMMDADPKAFFSQMAAMERAVVKGADLPKGKGGPGPDPDPDDDEGKDKGTERAAGLIDKLLTDFEEEHPEEGKLRKLLADTRQREAALIENVKRLEGAQR